MLVQNEPMCADARKYRAAKREQMQALERWMITRQRERRTKIYLAGKITDGDWRHKYVDGLRSSEFGSAHLQNAIRGRFDYTGPFFKPGEHGEFHGDGLHGAGEYVSESDHCQDMVPHHDVFANSLQGIVDADIVIAVVDDDAHGTLCEIGYAAGIGKKVIVIGAEGKECWFSKGFSVGGFWCAAFKSVDDALDWCEQQSNVEELLAKCESVPEKTLMAALIERLPPNAFPVPQYEIAQYRADFAFLSRKIILEVDGIEFHGNQDAFVKDRKRTRFLESHGWRVMRFAAKEILDRKLLDECVEEIAKAVLVEG